MIFTLEALPAKEGDCLLLHWGTAADKKLAVIDGGPGRIYDDELRPRLEEIAANLDVDQLPLEIVMVSHMDSDHVVGVRKLLGQVKDEVANQIPQDQRLLEVKRLWHNVFNDVLGDSINEYYKNLPTAALAGLNGAPDPAIVDKLTVAFRQRQGDSEEDARHNAWDIALILATHNNGRIVRDDHRFLFDHQQTSALNTPFRDSHGHPTLISTSDTPDPKSIAGLKITVAGPRKKQIEKLQKEFDDYITTHGHSAEAVLAAYADNSVKNLSSIVCLVEFDGKTILFTGDARGDHLLAGLGDADLLDNNGTLTVDILKVPHHGSAHNVEQAFFEKVIARTYVFSGDGKYGNPDRETLQWLVDARGTEPITMILTYDIDHIDTKRKQDYQIHHKPWDHDRDSLATFFSGLAHSGHQVTLHTGAPVKIDLGSTKVTW